MSRIHDYTKFVEGQDYVLDVSNPMLGYKEYYMTSCGKGVKPKDYVLLKSLSGVAQYQIRHIEYYYDPADMWIAMLEQCV